MKHIDMDYSIKKATPDMLPQILDIECQTFSDPWTEHFLSLYLLDNDRDFLVAVDQENNVLGYLNHFTVLDEGEIDNIAVRQDARRLGIGTGLLRKCIESGEEKNLKLLTLEVRASNVEAISLYEKHGFLEVGRRPGYYEKPREDAILMTLFLSKTKENP